MSSDRDRMPSGGADASTRLLLSTGDRLVVEGSPADVERALHDAARSSPGTLARLTAADSGAPVGVNPAHVVTLSSATDDAGG